MAQPAIHGRDHKPDWVEGGPGADPLDWLTEPVAGGTDEGEYAYLYGGVLGVAQDTFTRMDMVGGTFTGSAGDPFDITADGDGISMDSGGRYVVTASVYWDGFAETGMIALGNSAGPVLEPFCTPLGPTHFTTSGCWGFIPVGGYRLPNVYIWAYQSTSPAANSNARLIVQELL